MTVNYKTELALKKFKDEYEEISKEDCLEKTCRSNWLILRLNGYSNF